MTDFKSQPQHRATPEQWEQILQPQILDTSRRAIREPMKPASASALELREEVERHD